MVQRPFCCLPRPNRVADNASGNMWLAHGPNELVHSLVCTGVVHIQDSSGSCKEDIIFPPRKLSTTASQHIGSALTTNFEQFLLGESLQAFIQNSATKYGAVNLVAVGDAATANTKCIEQLFTFVCQEAKEVGLTATGTFTCCNLHQLSRLLALHMEHQSFSAAMFSVTRLHQHSTTRESTKDTMLKLLKEKFVWRPGEALPVSGLNSPTQRRWLLKLFTDIWDGEEPDLTADDLSDRKTTMKQLLEFFNCDILNTDQWVHICRGCHQSRQEALQDVSRPHRALTSCWDMSCHSRANPMDPCLQLVKTFLVTTAHRLLWLRRPGLFFNICLWIIFSARTITTGTYISMEIMENSLQGYCIPHFKSIKYPQMFSILYLWQGMAAFAEDVLLEGLPHLLANSLDEGDTTPTNVGIRVGVAWDSARILYSK